MGPLLSGHPRDYENWPLNRGWLLNGGIIKIRLESRDEKYTYVKSVEKYTYVRKNAKIIVKKNIKCPLLTHLLLFAVVGRGVVTRGTCHVRFR